MHTCALPAHSSSQGLSQPLCWGGHTLVGTVAPGLALGRCSPPLPLLPAPLPAQPLHLHPSPPKPAASPRTGRTAGKPVRWMHVTPKPRDHRPAGPSWAATPGLSLPRAGSPGLAVRPQQGGHVASEQSCPTAWAAEVPLVLGGAGRAAGGGRGPLPLGPFPPSHAPWATLTPAGTRAIRTAVWAAPMGEPTAATLCSTRGGGGNFVCLVSQEHEAMQTKPTGELPQKPSEYCGRGRGV